MRRLLDRCVLVPGLLLVLACASDPAPAPATPASPQSDGAPEPVARPWTRTFMEPAVLVAREIRIEGPAGLRDRVALRIEADLHDYEVATTPEGFLQVVSVKPGLGDVVVHCQLDRLEMAAETRVSVLERPGEVPVVVTAIGDAVWKTPAGGLQQGETLRLVGQEPR